MRARARIAVRPAGIIDLLHFQDEKSNVLKNFQTSMLLSVLWRSSIIVTQCEPDRLLDYDIWINQTKFQLKREDTHCGTFILALCPRLEFASIYMAIHAEFF